MKYNEHTIKKLIDALGNGEGRIRACKIANIDHQTLVNWERKYLDFLERIKKAEDDGNIKIKDLSKRKVIEDKSWQSGAWWLERKYSDEFANKQKIDHTTGGEKLSVLIRPDGTPWKPK